MKVKKVNVIKNSFVAMVNAEAVSTSRTQLIN